jgi:5-methylcytosine-specific restriction protein A
MAVSFDKLKVGSKYSRPHLAHLWGYRTYNAIARGVITPKGSKKIILFVTHEKQTTLPQYRDVFDGNTLSIEGELKGGTDTRITQARERGDEIHLFYRQKHHQDFTYHGVAVLMNREQKQGAPTRFTFELHSLEELAQNSIETEIATSLGDYTSGDTEGRTYLARHRRYERSLRNRAAALRIHGTSCQGCGFNFDDVYGGEHARRFIEVHHVRSITTGVRKIDPSTDLIPLCSNCHSMVHRQPGVILSLNDLKRLLTHRRK